VSVWPEASRACLERVDGFVRRAGLSGIGREGGTWSFDFYGDVKNTVFAPEGWRSDG
jgi:hypothetical protein